MCPGLEEAANHAQAERLILPVASLVQRSVFALPAVRTYPSLIHVRPFCDQILHDSKVVAGRIRSLCSSTAKSLSIRIHIVDVTPGIKIFRNLGKACVHRRRVAELCWKHHGDRKLGGQCESNAQPASRFMCSAQRHSTSATPRP